MFRLGIFKFRFIATTFIAVTLCSLAWSKGTDTIRVMQYNLLNYGASNNQPNYKNARIKTILQFVQPDIFGVNELSNGKNNPDIFLQGALSSEWERGEYINSRSANQANMLFWKKSKFGVVSQRSLCSEVRDIILYRLYYKDPLLAELKDTTFLNVIVAHLKAGRNEEDEKSRAIETQCVMSYLNNFAQKGNYVFMGDMNVYSSDEPCYTVLTQGANADTRFYDPVNRPGRWHSNAAFADLHAQSTRREALPDGGASGGMDDRFTQILVSESIMQNRQKVVYRSGSYNTIGQDGEHYKSSINDYPTNTSAPSSVIQALFESSDHLPVAVDMVFKLLEKNVSIQDINNANTDFVAVSPIQGNTIEILSNEQLGNLPVYVQVYSLNGSVVYANHNEFRYGRLTINASGDLQPGMYFVKILNVQTGETWVGKAVKAN